MKLMVWGGIGWNFKTKLLIIEDNINSELYWDEILIGSNLFEEADAAFGKDSWVLQQDNARPHVSSYIFKNLDYCGVPFIDDWPPYSPDLNIIEVVWAIMKKRLEMKKISTIDELRSEITNVWENLSFQTINGLVESMPKRRVACVKGGGYTITHY